MMVGYLSAIARLARQIQENGVTLPRYPQVIITDAETRTLLVDQVIFRIVPTKLYTQEIEQRLHTALLDSLGPDMSVKIELVEKIFTEKSAKRLSVKSSLSTQHTAGTRNL